MKTVYGFVLTICVLGLIACQTSKSDSTLQQAPSLPATPTIPPPPTLDMEGIAAGKVIYEQHCAACHGFALEGQPDWKVQNDDGTFKAPPHNEEGHTWHHADSQLIEAVKRGDARFEGLNVGGTSLMPAYEDILSDAEITAVLTYIKSTWPEDIRQLQWEVTILSSRQ